MLRHHLHTLIFFVFFISIALCYVNIPLQRKEIKGEELESFKAFFAAKYGSPVPIVNRGPWNLYVSFLYLSCLFFMFFILLFFIFNFLFFRNLGYIEVGTPPQQISGILFETGILFYFNFNFNFNFLF